MQASWRWLPDQIANGATHMAMDQAIATHADHVGCPTFRLYQWTPYCISLGYHQNTDILDLSCCKREGLDVVRRPTGGRAVFHSEEWTYTVAFPKRWVGTEKPESVYQMISQGLVQGLNRLGIPAKMEKRPLDLHTHYKSELASSCFSAAAKYEVVVEGKKLVGSAQRKYSCGILQHGSILTGETHAQLPFYFKDIDTSKRERMAKILTDKTACVQSLLGRLPKFQEGVEAIRWGMEEALGIRMENGELSEEEKSMMLDLRSEFSILENN
ncbi:lipoate--protein ligase family protein [candidate division KSB1 bacterium]|nr:lipoate--protein ligase family protein [candidate division KSB1 bacterium]